MVPLVEKIRTISRGATQRWVPIGSPGVHVALISRFSVRGSRAISASPPAAPAEANPAAVSFYR